MLDFTSFLRRSLMVSLLLPGWTLASECYPSPDSSRPQYLVGYGSLLYKEARKRKAEQAKVEVPVWVNDFKRGWLTRAKPDGLMFTGLGVVPASGEKFNGVLISLDAGKLTSLDRDEKLNCRIKVDRSKLSAMSNGKLPESGDIWIYTIKPKQMAKTASDYPILQSNVDVFLTGCIEQGSRFKIDDFADQCMKTTEGWSVHWSNDRRRPLDNKIVQTMNKQVDALLEKYDSKFYETIRTN